jgi:hypothetical protein
VRVRVRVPAGHPYDPADYAPPELRNPGAGDPYGFAVRDGRCAPEILWLNHETGSLSPTGHCDLLESLAAELRRHL